MYILQELKLKILITMSIRTSVFQDFFSSFYIFLLRDDSTIQILYPRYDWTLILTALMIKRLQKVFIYFFIIIFNQVFRRKTLVIKMMKVGGRLVGRASTNVSGA